MDKADIQTEVNQMDEKNSRKENGIRLTPAMKVAFLLGVALIVSAMIKMLDAQFDVVTKDRYVLAYMIHHANDPSVVKALEEYRDCTAISLNPLKTRLTDDECKSEGLDHGVPQELFDEVRHRTTEAMNFDAPGMLVEVYSGVERMLWGLPFVLFLFVAAWQQKCRLRARRSHETKT